MKELYVRDEARGRGVGRALLDTVRTAAQELGCTRLEWTADTDNPTALGFYEALGVPVNGGKVVYRLPVRPAGRVTSSPARALYLPCRGA